MSEHPGFWVRAYIRRANELDVVKEVECPGAATAEAMAAELCAEEIYDAVDATEDAIDAHGRRGARRHLVAYGHHAASTARPAPASPERPLTETTGSKTDTPD